MTPRACAILGFLSVALAAVPNIPLFNAAAPGQTMPAIGKRQGLPAELHTLPRSTQQDTWRSGVALH